MNSMATPKSWSKLTIELTTDCNLKCAGCPRTISIAENNWSNIHMPLETFKGVLDHIPPTNMVTLHGIGEPTLHPDFLEIVRLAKTSQKFQRIKITTNGLTRSPEFLAQSVAAGLDEIWVSVDSFDPIVVDFLREGTNPKKLKDRVQTYIKMGLPIHISNVVSSANIGELGDTLETLFELGNPPVHSQEFQDFGNDYGMLTAEDRQAALAVFSKHLLKHPTARVSPPQFASPKGLICDAPWTRPAISVQGMLTPCCTTFDPKHFGYANISEQSIEEIWSSAVVQTWMEHFYKDEIDMCLGCGLNPRTRGTTNSLSRSGKSGADEHVIKFLEESHGAV
jgi:MoaA/NifB/PqqE/SkfB family radical SAM enzyme